MPPYLLLSWRFWYGAEREWHTLYTSLLLWKKSQKRKGGFLWYSYYWNGIKVEVKEEWISRLKGLTEGKAICTLSNANPWIPMWINPVVRLEQTSTYSFLHVIGCLFSFFSCEMSLSLSDRPIILIIQSQSDTHMNIYSHPIGSIIHLYGQSIITRWYFFPYLLSLFPIPHSLFYYSFLLKRCFCLLSIIFQFSQSSTHQSF